MTPFAGGKGEFHQASESGRTVALAVSCQRDLSACAAAYPGLFPARPFDAALLSAVAAANAFGSPELTAAQLRVASRTALWIFGLDWLVDHVATSAAEVAGTVRRCLAVAVGDSPGRADELTQFLAALRGEMVAAPAFADHGSSWIEELRRMLGAMVREWSWKSDGISPSVAEYLQNADNFGATWVNVSHWISLGHPGTLANLQELREVSREVQRVLRLLNDLATYERDVSWGDLNALMLGVDRAEIAARTAALTERCAELIEPLRGRCAEAAGYLERQLGYSTGFYGVADYWGSL